MHWLAAFCHTDVGLPLVCWWPQTYSQVDRVSHLVLGMNCYCFNTMSAKYQHVLLFVCSSSKMLILPLEANAMFVKKKKMAEFSLGFHPTWRCSRTSNWVSLFLVFCVGFKQKTSSKMLTVHIDFPQFQLPTLKKMGKGQSDEADKVCL